MMALHTRVGAASKRGGRVRNEDAWEIGSHGNAFAVSDGIGGGEYGDVASKVACTVAIESANHALECDAPPDILSCFKEANEAVVQTARWLKAFGDMGATLTVAYLDEETETVRLFWVGDTSVYILNSDGELVLAAPPDRVCGSTNALASAVGIDCHVEPRFEEIGVKPGDRLLICTDGVWESMEDCELIQLLGSSENAPWLAETMVRAAVDKGGFDADNATAIVVIVDDVGTSSDKETTCGVGCDTPDIPKPDSMAIRIPIE